MCTVYIPILFHNIEKLSGVCTYMRWVDVGGAGGCRVARAGLGGQEADFLKDGRVGWKEFLVLMRDRQDAGTGLAVGAVDGVDAVEEKRQALQVRGQSLHNSKSGCCVARWLTRSTDAEVLNSAIP